MNMGRVAVQAGGKTPADQQNLARLSDLEFTKSNFNFLIYEVLKLRDEKLMDLKKIDDQQNMIIALLSDADSVSISPLKIAG